MMIKHFRFLVIVSWVATLMLSACGGEEAPSATTVSTTRRPTATATLPSTQTPTATKVHTAVSTSTPSALPQPTETVVPLGEGALDRYALAMRPAFVEDLIAIGPVSRYQITVTVDPETSMVSGQQTVDYVNTASVAQDVVYLRLLANLPGYGGEMTVGNLAVDGQVVEGRLEQQSTALRVPLGAPLPPGAKARIQCDFALAVARVAGQGYGQLIYAQDVMALANFFPLIPAYDEGNCAAFGGCVDGWNVEYAVPYGDAVFSEVALYELWVTAPEGWTVVASGSTVAQTPNADGTVTWQIVSGPVRELNLVLSPRFEVASQTVEDVVVNSYYLPEDVDGGERVLKWVVDSLAFFSQQFGPYPFAEMDVVATPTVAGGIEYPGLIVMPIRSYGQTGGFFQWATVHEVAHQWWYGLVGNDQQDEPWVDEALVQYSTVLYYEFQEGWDGAVAEMLEPWYWQVAGTPEDDFISLPVAAYSEATYGPLVYGKGPLFFEALRQEVGDEAFEAMLRAYLDAYRYQIASASDLLGLVQDLSEQDLTALYQEWIGP